MSKLKGWRLLWSRYDSCHVQLFVRCNVFYWERKAAFSLSVHILLDVCGMHV